MPNAPSSFAPPRGFDPAGKDWQELFEYRIPQEPDQNRLPELNKAWRRLFEQPVSFEYPQWTAIKAGAGHKHLACGARSYQKTGNWCGALITPDSGSQCVLMFGEWTVPALSRPPTSLRLPDDPTTYHCVTWIGLDGDRRYFNASLPQVGTEQILTADGNTTCSAWFQWWARDQQELMAFKLENLSIKPGETVMAMIWAYEPHQVSVAFRTRPSGGTKGQEDKLFIFTVEAPEVALPSSASHLGQPEISGATAEWIMERPQTPDLKDASFLPFPRHDPVRFSNCVIGSAPVSSRGSGTAPGPRQAHAEKRLVRPRLLRLFESVPDRTVAQTRLLSLPHRLSDTSIEIRYCGGLTSPQDITALAMPRDGRNMDAYRQASGRESP